MRIIKRNGESISRNSPLFVPPAQGVAEKTCGERLDEEPFYRCSRKRNHSSDHAAHAGYGSNCVMVARWENIKDRQQHGVTRNEIP